MLKRRLSSLRLTVEGTWLEVCVDALHAELEERGIRLKPHAWISSEWFSPDNTAGIAIPFYLAHPRLMALEKKKMFDVEGGTWAECMAILRHEAGHAIQHAYQLQRRRRWQQLFGRRRSAIRATTGPTRRAGTLSSIFGFGMRRAIRTRISPRPSRCG